MKHHTPHGFSLVELSIVVLITGLVIGGITVSKRLVEAAERQAQIAQIAEYNGAVSSFVDKYRYPPGDLPNGVALGLQTANGDGDSRVEWDSVGGDDEFQEAFSALSLAGLIAGTTEATTGGYYDPAEHRPARVGDGSIIFVYADGLGNGWYAPYSGTTAGDLTGLEVHQIDTIIDDGLPYQGDMTVVYLPGGFNTNTPFNGFFAGTTAANTNCIVSGAYDPTSTTTYTRDDPDAECLFWIRANY